MSDAEDSERADGEILTRIQNMRWNSSKARDRVTAARSLLNCARTFLFDHKIDTLGPDVSIYDIDDRNDSGRIGLVYDAKLELYARIGIDGVRCKLDELSPIEAIRAAPLVAPLLDELERRIKETLA